MSILTQEALLVRNALLEKGLENPIICLNISYSVRKHLIESHMRSIVHLLKLDLQSDSLLNTPKRVSTMYVDEIFSGLNYSNFPKINIIKNVMKVHDMITVRGINFTSICEHHFIIFDGTITISYIPKNNIIGLSKINRIVQFFSKRPQLQERLTKQIFLALKVLLNTDSIAIFIDAMHYCVKARGIHDSNSTVTTTELGGLFKDSMNTRKEFLYLVVHYNK
ncbi:GTP cyclohydrolase I FolE [Candidatus Blochmannia ocreatus (nom. nud.)]|uniref:GTP cyclohydrolase 1 n=1 Tax=Candidatus Blochmannia ocreatus (nom. nud.) TaxID=251538 RepID=A0ABY4SYP8_9ENTR|nr:GTP cyclohydrolase I FolE [Candidatus Blochmannia ocreatus]URJ24964.1 GTP cyclohydrolase I FolE [Candidatus Blochmannia ocreatus]